MVLRDNGNGKLTLRDVVTGELVNVDESVFSQAYEEVYSPPQTSEATDLRGRQA
jgi:hypothetical protein